jgi:uncharacterized protein YbaA (DUF1428 family)
MKPMQWALFDITGNLIESFEDEKAARDALGAIVSADPEVAGDIALLRFDERGMARGDAVFSVEANQPASR